MRQPTSNAVLVVVALMGIAEIVTQTWERLGPTKDESPASVVASPAPSGLGLGSATAAVRAALNYSDEEAARCLYKASGLTEGQRHDLITTFTVHSDVLIRRCLQDESMDR